MKAYLGFLLIPLALLLAFAWTYFLPFESAKLPLPTVKTLKVPVSPDAVSPVMRREPAHVDLRALMPYDVEPAPRAVAGKAKSPFLVSAILVDGERRVVQIGSEMYEQGDTLADYKVDRIEPMRVLLVSHRKGGERLWLHMSKGF
ncbi:MAG: hypothetical protein HQ445_05775 [Polaromonas sp.]|nr:hypothetical protein [Polaromonas sp.]